MWLFQSRQAVEESREAAERGRDFDGTGWRPDFSTNLKQPRKVQKHQQSKFQGNCKALSEQQQQKPDVPFSWEKQFGNKVLHCWSKPASSPLVTVAIALGSRTLVFTLCKSPWQPGAVRRAWSAKSPITASFFQINHDSWSRFFVCVYVSTKTKLYFPPGHVSTEAFEGSYQMCRWLNGDLNFIGWKSL